MTLSVKFWGVRGSIATPLSSHMRYGGNTSCLEVNADGHRIVLDAGTGIRSLGLELLKAEPFPIQLLLTHTHWDHVTGFPFFVPAYQPDWQVSVRAGHLKKHGSSVYEVLALQMEGPMFPVPISTMQARIEFDDFVAGASFDLYEGVHVRTAPLNHPNDATGYRIECGGRSVCYVTDTEHVPGRPDGNVLGLIEQADLVIYDSTYTDEEFPAKVGWGHSTWQEGMRLCQAAGARRLAIFHHDPDHDDEFMDRVEAEAREAWSGNLVARENMVIDLG